MTGFVHLHLHSAYSLSEGAIKISKLKDLCLKHQMPAVAVTDTNNLFGALEASETLAAAGVQPITGTQQSFECPPLSAAEKKPGAAPLVLLVQNLEGYENLMRLSSRAFTASVRDDGPCADLGWLDAGSGGLLCLTGGYDGAVDRLLRLGKPAEARGLLERLKSLFPGRLYVELQRHEGRDWRAAEAELVDLAYALALPLVATNEPFFAAPDDYEAHDALLCIAEGAYVHQDDRRKVTPDHYLKSPDQMAALFADLPEAVGNSLAIARRCAFRPKTRQPILPRYVAGDAAEEALELEREAKAGLEARLASIKPSAPIETYRARLAEEIAVINRMGFPGYFLIVADFIKWAKARGIPVGPGRGSGAGSLVAYALTITDLDPLRFGLLFERFLNPERVSMPDFDIDFCQDRRDEVIRYVRDKYGADRVAQIITFGKLQARAVLRDVGRVIGLPFGQVDRLCKLVPNNPADPVTLEQALDTEPRLKEERARDESVAALLEKALKLEGLYRHASTHAAGVVIGDRPLEQLTPLYLDPRSDMPATQFNMKWVEPAGLVKFDFLGLKTLTVIARAVAIAAARGVAIDMEAIPLDDQKSFAMLGEGAAVGVFQLESTGMRQTLRSMKPDCLEDIIALVSLYRPGPMENIPTYVERKQGLLAPDYLHPTLEPVLKETYGVIIYQEQVMQIAQILSGYSLGEADLLRRAMGKKKKEEMDQQRKRFVEGAAARGVDPVKAGSIFELVEKFAGYGFNKSHAAAYALIAYQTAWLKANHPAAFLAASMSLDRANTDKLAVFMKEARRTDVPILPPHVNRSEADFSVDENGAIVYALSAVKNVGEAAMAEIARERVRAGAFLDLYDVAERVDLKVVGKRALENLARAGALDGLGAGRESALAAAEMLVRYSAQIRAEKTDSQGGLFDTAAAPALARPRLPQAQEKPPIDRLNEERGALGFYFSGHPLDEYAHVLQRLRVISSRTAKESATAAKTVLQLAGVVRSVRMRRSKAGKPFAFVEVADAEGEFEMTVFSEALGQCRDLLEVGKIILVSATVELREDEARFTAEAIRALDAAAAQSTSLLRISVASEQALAAVQKRIAAAKPPGRGEGGKAVLALKAGRRAVELGLSAEVACTPAMRGALKTIDGVLDVELI